MSDTPIQAEVLPPEGTSQAVALRQETGTLGAALPAGDIRPPITAAQAKVEAVAALTMSAYEKAATLELTPEETAKLQADFPDDAFQPGAAGKEHLIYIEHAHLRDRFNAVFGMGKWAIVPRNRWAEPFKTQKGDEGSRVYVEAMLIVRGCFVGEAVGAMEYYPHNASQNYGDAVEGAKTAAFRRCAKEFGVGLQAWKKDFCEAWWKRRRGGRDFGRKPAQDAPGQPDSPKPPSASTPTPKPPPSPKSAPILPPPVPFPTEQSRQKMLDSLKANPGQPNYDIVTEFFRKLSDPCPLMPKEPLEHLELRFVPATIGQMKDLAEKLADFGNGGQAAWPYRPHVEPANLPPGVTTPAQVVPKVVQEAEKKAKDPEWWKNVIVPIPHKNEKRDVYLRHPDTLGGLYDLRHGQDEEGQAARQRLWGIVENHSEAKPWVGRDGKEHAPSATDIAFSEAVRAFKAWWEQNHPGERL